MNQSERNSRIARLHQLIDLADQLGYYEDVIKFENELASLKKDSVKDSD